jgi:ubiquinone/menaquinone biosynthesis C-methylase UbiE
MYMADQASFLDVDRIVHALSIAPGMKVADLGCGSGYFVIALAKIVGPNGTVTAVDVMKEALESVHARAEGMGLKNVTTVRADLEVLGGTKIADNSQDLVLLKNILFQSRKKDQILREAARVAKPGGRLVVIDWAKGKGGLGPPDELRTNVTQVGQLAEQAGMRLDGQLVTDAFHFGAVFTK